MRIAYNFRSAAAVRDRARAGWADPVGVVPEGAGLMGIGRSLPCGAPHGELGLAHVKIERRTDVAHAETARAAAQPPLRDWCGYAAKSPALDSSACLAVEHVRPAAQLQLGHARNLDDGAFPRP
jgi:hypothetical protein